MLVLQQNEQRILSRTERLLADYLDNERQAIALAPHIYLPEGLTPEEQAQRIEEQVISVWPDWRILYQGKC